MYMVAVFSIIQGNFIRLYIDGNGGAAIGICRTHEQYNTYQQDILLAAHVLLMVYTRILPPTS
ncbi:predicted protein [Sclerotinia sclerotiorum 1980 UF-70]|uniref:Uncharacterized protein n=1 Tax=Sclerotinia sclerotiorum (strain ATCC 18683 / 1980 / Ss-1) TaxID=665079 RepID=A7ES79_SCLS1|nr:predicted protein [Sclerotinia sclerotiorum 1980 UF-70]EDN92321.1 predicted protein [Sclerotinia sclerotiorum 1980 UF-70]